MTLPFFPPALLRLPVRDASASNAGVWGRSPQAPFSGAQHG